MGWKSAILLLLLVLSISTVLAFDSKKSAEPVIVKDKNIEQMRAVPQFSAAEICSVRHAGDAYWLIYYWFAGAELYKTYQNPAMTCTAPYPFSVEEVYMVLYFGLPTTVYIQVDVETADMTDPACPKPGDILSISQEWIFDIPAKGLWRIAVPLDSAAVVNEPYFAGFYVANQPESPEVDSIALVVDTLPQVCRDYNIWDTEIGYVDLGDETNEFFTFPGKILLYSAGTPGGTGGYDPMPDLTMLQPKADQLVNGPLDCWVWDKAASKIVDSVRYEYRTNTTAWTRFGVDLGDNHALRNGVDPSGSGPGYVSEFNYFGLTEDMYRLRAIAYDTLLRTASVSLEVSIDPTSPKMDFIYPSYMDTICVPYTFTAYTDDEDITSVKFYKKLLSTDFSKQVVALNQFDYGNNDDDPDDGNPVADGEFGDYYCGPVAGAIAAKYWFDRGYTKIMREFSQMISIDTVVERMAVQMSTRENDGTYDDFLVGGLENYIASHGEELYVKSYFKPDYMTTREAFEERQLLPILGLSGTPGVYVVLSGFTGLDDGGGQYQITISDPITGAMVNTYMRNVEGGAQVQYNGSWLDLDILVGVGCLLQENTRHEIGTATKSASNWVYNWQSTTTMSDDSLYYVTVIAADLDGRTDTTTTLIRYHCNVGRVVGDYNGDDTADLADVATLINYIFLGGPEPIGGAHRADANCDGSIDISDVTYLVNYIYSGGDAPCY